MRGLSNHWVSFKLSILLTVLATFRTLYAKFVKRLLSLRKDHPLFDTAHVQGGRTPDAGLKLSLLVASEEKFRYCDVVSQIIGIQ